jgi:hypothetical protein
MAIRIYRPHEQEIIYVTAVGCKYISGPFSWDRANISIDLTPPGAEFPTSCRVIDQAIGFELVCSDAMVVRGLSTDSEKTFDNILGEAI